MSAGEIPNVRPDPFATQNAASAARDYPALPASTSSDVSAPFGRWLGRSQSEVKARLSSAYWRSRRASQSALSKVRHEAQRIRTERPMPALAVISGSAFALGLTLAILRSRRT